MLKADWVSRIRLDVNFDSVAFVKPLHGNEVLPEYAFVLRLVIFVFPPVETLPIKQSVLKMQIILSIGKTELVDLFACGYHLIKLFT